MGGFTGFSFMSLFVVRCVKDVDPDVCGSQMIMRRNCQHENYVFHRIHFQEEPKAENVTKFHSASITNFSSLLFSCEIFFSIFHSFELLNMSQRRNIIYTTCYLKNFARANLNT